MASQSLVAVGVVTAPGISATIAQIAAGSLVQGQAYNAAIRYYFTGTPADPNDTDNLRLKYNNAFPASQQLNIPAVINAVQEYDFEFVCTNTLGGFVVLCSPNAATAGAVYHASIVLTPIDTDHIVPSE